MKSNDLNLKIAEESISDLIDSCFSYRFVDKSEYAEIKEEFLKTLKGIILVSFISRSENESQ
jgi:hypothetical protein